MTDRRPPGTSMEGWVDQRIREAQERGAFDDNPLHGRPLPSIEEPLGDYDLVAKIAQREGVDVAPVLLPPSILVMRELDALPALLERQQTPDQVREILLQLNKKIRDVHLVPQLGPPLLKMPFDVEAEVAEWVATRPVPEPEPEVAAPQAQTTRRRWFRRRR